RSRAEARSCSSGIRWAARSRCSSPRSSPRRSRHSCSRTRSSRGRAASPRPAPSVMVGFALSELPRVGEWASRQRVTRLEAERAVELGLRIIAADPSTIPDELVRLHVEQLVRHQQNPDAGPAFLEAARSLLALGRRRDVVRWIVGSVKCPVLVVHGREDRLVPLGFAMGALELRPDWDMRLIPKVGHVPQMEAPDRWLAAVEPSLAGLGARYGAAGAERTARAS